MAVIEVSVSPSSFPATTKYYVGSYGSHGEPLNVSVTPSRNVIKFDLSMLGANPTIKTATLRVTSTHHSNDSINIQIGSLQKSPRSGYALDVTSLIANGVDSATVAFYAYLANIKDCTIHATLTATLTVEIEGELPPTDRRSEAEISETSVAFGDTVHLTVTPARGFTPSSHNYKFAVGDYVSDWISFQKDQTTAEFVVPTAWMAALPSSSSGTLTITLDTLDNGQSVGTREYTIQVTVPEGLKPTMSNVSHTVVNPATLTGNEILTGVTRLRFTIGTLTGSPGATIASIRYAGWGDAITVNKPASTSNITQLSTVVQQTGALSLTITATDTRGRTVSTVLTTLPATPYEPPSFTSVSYLRCAPDGTPLERGSTAKVLAAFKCDTTAIAGNTVSGVVSLRQEGADQWLIRNATLLNNAEMIFDTLTLDTMLGYEIILEITDNVMSVQRVLRLPALQYMLHFSNNGRSIGIGQVAEALGDGEAGRLTVNPAWNVYIGGQQTGGQKDQDLMLVLAALAAEVSGMHVEMIQMQNEIDALRS